MNCISTTSAEHCRENNWWRGTRLAGDDGYGEVVIQITAVGDELILARQISFRGQPHHDTEATWTLQHRYWRKVE